MIEDKLLMLKFKRGSEEALRRIYEKYEGYLMTVAAALLNDVNTAEDIVHDFFVWFAGSAEKLRLDRSLKGYLVTCVANRARDEIRARKRQSCVLNNATLPSSDLNQPEFSAVSNEESQKLSLAMSQLPYEQREVIMLHLHGGMMFTQIAKLHNVSVNTIRSRYRYGLDKLRSLLDSEVIE
ncbi:MAG: RNA polymerase sigma factor [Planctomycetota bacterium]|jgi:RNA polymerase sigma-70 factor (ECF subfamily)